MEAVSLEELETVILQTAALVALTLLIIRCISKDVEATVVVCIRTWKRISRSLDRGSKQ